MTHYRGLTPKLENFTFNDGIQKRLVCLSGTIPVPYRGANYNIPVTFWILDTHPLHAPMGFVCPTPDMAIRVSRHVDQNGKIYLPYLHEWSNGNSDLLGLIQICIITFSEQPPVFARAQVPEVLPPNPMTNMSMPTPYPPAANPQPVASTAGSGNTISQEHLKLSLLSAVEDKIKRLLREEFTTGQVEIESLTKIQTDLEESKRSMNANLTQMQTTLNDLGRSVDELSLLEADLTAKSNKLEDDTDPLDIDSAVTVPYPLMSQLTAAHAEDAAIDDSIYYLGDGLRAGVLDTDSFLKSVRNISRRQFFLKLTVSKCRAKGNLATV